MNKFQYFILNDYNQQPSIKWHVERRGPCSINVHGTRVLIIDAQYLYNYRNIATEAFRDAFPVIQSRARQSHAASKRRIFIGSLARGETKRSERKATSSLLPRKATLRPFSISVNRVCDFDVECRRSNETVLTDYFRSSNSSILFWTRAVVIDNFQRLQIIVKLENCSRFH